MKRACILCVLVAGVIGTSAAAYAFQGQFNCFFCNGTGRNSVGMRCFHCNGTGCVEGCPDADGTMQSREITGEKTERGTAGTHSD